MPFSSLLRVASLCALCICLAAPLWAAEETPTAFTSEAAAFSLTYPAGWQIANEATSPLVTVAVKPLANKRDFPRVLVISAIFVGDHQVSMDRTFEHAINSLPGYMNGVTVSKTGEMRLGGMPGKSVEYSFSAKKDTDMRTIAILTMANGYLYMAICMGDPTTFDAAKAEFKEVLQSLVFLTPKPSVKQKLSLGYYLTAPPDWEEAQRGNSGWVIQRPATADATAFRANISVKCEELAEDFTPEAYAKEVQTATLQALPGFSVVESKDVTLCGAPARRLCFRMDLRGKPMQCWAYFLVNRRQGYTVLCTAPSAEFDALQSDFTYTAATFAIVPKPEFR